jgi:hypothetical protein
VNAKLRRKLIRRKRRMERRLDKTKLGVECPVLLPPTSTTRPRIERRPFLRVELV